MPVPSNLFAFNNPISTEKKCHVSSLVTNIHVRYWPEADTR